MVDRRTMIFTTKNSAVYRTLSNSCCSDHSDIKECRRHSLVILNVAIHTHATKGLFHTGLFSC